MASSMARRASGRILVVDDTEANRYALGQILERAGFDVAEARTGADGLRLARECPDLIILDVKLPDLDGYEVCRRLKSDPATAEVPVLHVSANFVTPEDQAEGIENGAEGYLCQPVNPSMLVATVRSLVRAHRAEAALRESEERFRAMADELPLIVWVHGADGAQQFVNRTFCDFFGVTREEMRGGRWQLLMHPDEADRYASEFMACVRDRRPFHGEVRVRRADGAWRRIESWARPRVSGTGEFLGFVGTSADVTDRRAAEDQLRRSQETFYHLIQDNPFGVYVVDADFRLAQVSLGAQNVFANVRPLLGRDFADVLRTVWAEPFASAAIGRFRHTLETGEPYVSPSTIERRQDIGEVEAYDWRIERITLPDGRLGVVCYFYDLSERQRWEETLRESEARLADQKEAFELAISGASIHDVLNVLVRAGQRQFGPESRTAIFIADPEGARLRFGAAAGLTEAYARAVDGFEISPKNPSCGSAAYTGKAVIVRDVAADPLWAPYLQLAREHGIRACWSFPIRSAAARVVGTFAVYHRTPREPAPRDLERVALLAQTAGLVIERHNAEDALRHAKDEAERANSAKDQFLAVLSHELRTPLTPVVMSVAALEVEPGLPHAIREELAMIRRNISLETRLIDDLLDLSRVMNGKMTLHAEEVGVHALLNAATDILTSEIESRRMKLVWRLDAESDEVNADAARLQQVFWNLVKNAVKFTPEGGTIRIRTWNPQPRRVAVEVADTGKGIDPAALPRIFNAFEQGGTAINRNFGGLGLGLTISKAIVDMHGGTIRADSDGASRGARFTVELATTGLVKKLVDRIERQGAGEDGAAEALRVLLVEDHLDTLRTLRRLMESMGFAVTAASTVAAALRLVGAHEFDVLVSDIGLPDATGLELMRQIRERGLALPGVALTGYGMESDIRSTREVGFDAHLTKPVDVSHLAATVRRLARQQDAPA